jgi:catechol 2,3-dioxygenase-like lactoylglutathione lyase family enzyme
VFERVTIWAADREASERFYGLVLRTLGTEQSRSDARDARWGVLIVRSSDESNPPTQRVHLGFTAQSRGRVDEFWRIGTGGGYRDDGQPGLRPEYGPDYYGGFLLDPDGNSAEAIHSDRPDPVPPGQIDHLWIRVRDLQASKRFYETIAPHAGIELGDDEPGRVQFTGERYSFSLIDDDRPLTENVHLAFPARDDATVRAFHEAALAAGYEDNGGPGERAVYHPGYYGAFVLDPDGHNVEVVNHNRR